MFEIAPPLNDRSGYGIALKVSERHLEGMKVFRGHSRIRD